MLRPLRAKGGDPSPEAWLAFHEVAADALDPRSLLLARLGVDDGRRMSAAERTGSESLAIVAGSVGGAQMNWLGSRDLIPWAPHAYLDKILVNLRPGDVAADLVSRIARFSQLALGSHEPPFALVVPLASPDPRLKLMVTEFLPKELTDSLFASEALEQRLATGQVASALAEVRVRFLLDEPRDLFGATTKFRPRRAANPVFAEIAFWELWDWTCFFLFSTSPAQGGEELRVLVKSLYRQCDYYVDHGPPRVASAGTAPARAMREFM